jgi:hypothetical protein
VCALALAFGGNALAAYDPSLVVVGATNALNANNTMFMSVAQGENDDASGVITLYSPPGYGVTLTQAPGTQLGELAGVVKVGALGGARVNIQGTVRTDNPASYVSNPCSPGTHEAVWVLEFTLAGNPIRLPMYVDRVTTAPESAFASARIRTCLASPYVPPPQGAQAGASLIQAIFFVDGVFRNPGTRGSYPWNGVFVPYTPGTATPNPGNAAQSTSIVQLPAGLAFRVKKQKRRGRTFALATTCITRGGRPVRGIRVNVHGGRTARAATALNARRVATGRTNARGCVTSRILLRTRVIFLEARATIPTLGGQGCQPTIVPRCANPNVGPSVLFSRILRVRR